jgi:hypothetical protein
MTSTNEDLRKPVPLRQYLDAGCDPSAIVPLDQFTEALLTIDQANQRNERFASEYRSRVERVLAGDARGVHTVDRHGDGWHSLQQFVTAMSWQADLLEDPSLGARVIELMSPGQRGDLDRFVEGTLRPHPLHVHVGQDTTSTNRQRVVRCGSCGETLDEGAVRLAVGRDEDDDDDDVGPWCFGCVSAAYEAMKRSVESSRTADQLYRSTTSP